jgi:uncharacterized membrane protein
VPAGWRLFGVMLVLGVLVTVLTGVFAGWGYAPSAGWSAAAVTFCAVTWVATHSRDAEQTATMATRDDPSATITDLLLLLANLASLLAVAYLLVQAHSTHGVRQALQAGLAVLSVAASWALVHILFMLRYAVLYYSGSVGGINFNQEERPAFLDFAYLAFTIGMTFQVSDTDLKTKEIRRTALRHALVSFPLGAVIIAASINLVSGLAK